MAEERGRKMDLQGIAYFCDMALLDTKRENAAPVLLQTTTWLTHCEKLLLLLLLSEKETVL